MAINMPKEHHKKGRAYGGKNNNTQSSRDASNLEAAGQKDIQAYKDMGVSGPVLTNLNKMVKTNMEYDKILGDCL